MKNSTHTRNRVGILGMHVSNAALDLFFGVFLMSKLYQATGGNIAALATFQLIQYIVAAICYYPLSFLIKRGWGNWVLRASAVITVITITIIMAFQSQVAELYLLFSVLYGIAIGTFWAPINVVETSTMGGKHMGNFKIWYHVTTSLSKIIFPLTLGALIEYVSFLTSVLLVLGIALVLTIFTFVAKKQPMPTGKFSISEFYKEIRRLNYEKPLWHYFFIVFTKGIFGVGSLCVTVLIIIVYANNFSMGILASIFSAGAITLLLLYRFIKNNRTQNVMLFLSALLPFLLSFGLLFVVNPTTLILFQLGYVTLAMLMKSKCDAVHSNIVHDLGRPDLMCECNVFGEFAILIGRIVAFSSVIIMSYIGSFLGFKIIAVVSALTMLVNHFLIQSWYRRYGKTPTESLR